VRPHDPLLVLIWLGKIQSDVVKDDQNKFFKMVRVQMMNNVCTKIVRTTSGNVIWEI
jgi:hypothetical protein